MKTTLKFGVSVMFVLSLLGCQFVGSPSDKALISELLNTFEEQMERTHIDIDGYMSLLSENYSNYYDKQALRQLMLANPGAYNDVDVSFSRAKIVMNDDGTASVSPVQIKGPSNTVTETLTLVKEEGSWFILKMERHRRIY